jgi:hypothetical protein
VPRVRRMERFAMLLTTAFLVWLFYVPYLASFTLPADPAWFRNYAPAYEWLRKNATPEDVVLCDDIMAMHVVTPANRKVVSTDRSYSNPYLDWQSRATDRQTMFNSIAANNTAQFRALAARYGVNYYIFYDMKGGKTFPQSFFPGFRLAYDNGAIAIYRVSL